MLINAEDSRCVLKLDHELAKNPAFRKVVSAIDTDCRPFALEPEAQGIEVMPQNEVKLAPNRCRLKLFKPREGNERLCAFFYKRSNLSFSRDRFAYGAVEFLPESLSDTEIQVWLEWLVSGFDPERRPDRLRRGFLYNVPD